jgi:hypothetical protein
MGTREAIEAGKQWAKEERERQLHDPYRKLWRELVQRVHYSEEGFEGLTEAEKQYFAVGLLDGEVFNGGFDQYFFNNSGSHHKYAILGLEAMGATQAIAILREAKELLFGGDAVPEDTAERRRILRSQDSQSRNLVLDQLDAKYWKDPDGLADRTEAFAITHNLVAATT